MKKKILLLIVTLLLIPLGAVAQEAYAVLSTDKTTLSFYFDSKKTSREGMIYGLNTWYNDPGWYGYLANIAKVVFDASFANARPTSTYRWFYHCEKLKEIEGIHNLNTDNVTNMYLMFDRCSALTTLDVSNFNTGNVTNMSNMFSGCSGLTTLDVSNFNTGNVTNMSYLFDGCSGLTTLDVSNFNTDKVTDMKDMFCSCSSLTTLDVSNFNTGNVTNMEGMFDGCNGLTTLNVGNFNTSNVTDMENMFCRCSGLTTLDVSNFNTGNVTYMDGMFLSCSGLTTLDVSNFNTGNVKEMQYMFAGCNGLTTLDVSNFNTGNVAYMGGMFYGCSNLTTLYCGDNWNTHKVSLDNSFSMFNGCTKLIGGTGTKYDSNHTNKEYAHVDGGTSNPGYLTYKGENAEPEAYAVLSTDKTTFSFYYDGKKASREGTVYSLNTGSKAPDWYGKTLSITKAVFDASFADARPTTTHRWFYECTGLTEIEGLNYLNTDNVTDMSEMFYGCFELLSLDLSSFSTDNVTNMNSMFSYCKKLTALNVSNFKTSNITDMGSMFSFCKSLTSLDLSGFDTGNVNNMSYMFCYCSSLPSLDLSNFDTGYVTTMREMFSSCSSLTSLDMSSFNTCNVTNMREMFSNCRSLTSLDLSNFKSENVTNMSYLFNKCSSLTSLHLNNFNTSNVTDMCSMFLGCSGLTTLDISSFNTSNVNYMDKMFSDCNNLNTIFSGDNWNTDKVTDSRNMFDNCTNLIGGAGTKYDANHKDKEYAHVDGGPSNPGYFTYKGEGGEEDDDLQRYLDSLIDTEDSFEGGIYTRRFLNGDWQTLYVPFELNYEDWAGRFEVASIGGFYWYDDDDDNYVDRQELVATIVESGSLQANFPYLIRAKSKMGGTLSVKVSGNVSQKVTVAYMEIPPVTYNFVGNYTLLTGLMSAGRYRLQGGSLFIPLSDSEVLLPYRWYMTMDVASTQSVRLNIVTNDETTGIEDVKRSKWMIQDMQPDAQHPAVFDISGRRVDSDIKSLPKGIYLINNRKCVIK